MVQDQWTAEQKGMDPTEDVDITREGYFLDGPVTRRVAVLDFDPNTGVLVPGTPFVPPDSGKKLGRYDIPKGGDQYDLGSAAFRNVSVWATVLETMYMFEENDVLGRELSWSFPGNQLLIVPRAGKWANAFYERSSRSLQFFYMTAGEGIGRNIYTSLSRDIVAHETGHAILDGITPWLYDAITPQSLALHEAIADLTALHMAFRSHKLRERVLDQTGGKITESTAFSAVAEEFGRARDPNGRSTRLRSLLNSKVLRPDVRLDPHELSEVLTGALYKLMVDLHESKKEQLRAEEATDERSISGQALWFAASQFKRMLFRALDYLPPGEISFADYGRALLAADQASHPDAEQARASLRKEFVARGIVPNESSLEVRTGFEEPAVTAADLESLVNSDWAAYQFAERSRDLLGIPETVPFYVPPRLDVTKEYHQAREIERVRECVFKVSWEHIEDNPKELRRRYASRRRMSVGTTLAIDWGTRRVRALLTTNPDLLPAAEARLLKEDRNEMLRNLARRGLLHRVGGGGRRTTEPGLPGAIALITDGVLRVRGSARLLHVSGEAS
jgi:hypothetical protein